MHERGNGPGARVGPGGIFGVGERHAPMTTARWARARGASARTHQSWCRSVAEWSRPRYGRVVYGRAIPCGVMM
jgi:hypothetical protein